MYMYIFFAYIFFVESFFILIGIKICFSSFILIYIIIKNSKHYLHSKLIFLMDHISCHFVYDTFWDYFCCYKNGSFLGSHYIIFLSLIFFFFTFFLKNIFLTWCHKYTLLFLPIIWCFLFHILLLNPSLNFFACVEIG